MTTVATNVATVETVGPLAANEKAVTQLVTIIPRTAIADIALTAEPSADRLTPAVVNAATTVAALKTAEPLTAHGMAFGVVDTVVPQTKGQGFSKLNEKELSNNEPMKSMRKKFQQRSMLEYMSMSRPKENVSSHTENGNNCEDDENVPSMQKNEPKNVSGHMKYENVPSTVKNVSSTTKNVVMKNVSSMCGKESLNVTNKMRDKNVSKPVKNVNMSGKSLNKNVSKTTMEENVSTAVVTKGGCNEDVQWQHEVATENASLLKMRGLCQLSPQKSKSENVFKSEQNENASLWNENVSADFTREYVSNDSRGNNENVSSRELITEKASQANEVMRLRNENVSSELNCENVSARSQESIERMSSKSSHEKVSTSYQVVTENVSEGKEIVSENEIGFESVSRKTEAVSGNESGRNKNVSQKFQKFSENVSTGYQAVNENVSEGKEIVSENENVSESVSRKTEAVSGNEFRENENVSQKFQKFNENDLKSIPEGGRPPATPVPPCKPTTTVTDARGSPGKGPGPPSRPKAMRPGQPAAKYGSTDARLRGLDPGARDRQRKKEVDKLPKGGTLPGTRRLSSTDVDKQRLGMAAWVSKGKPERLKEVGRAPYGHGTLGRPFRKQQGQGAASGGKEGAKEPPGPIGKGESPACLRD